MDLNKILKRILNWMNYNELRKMYNGYIKDDIINILYIPENKVYACIFTNLEYYVLDYKNSIEFDSPRTFAIKQYIHCKINQIISSL
jgi:hypothetical protein